MRRAFSLTIFAAAAAVLISGCGSTVAGDRGVGDRLAGPLVATLAVLFLLALLLVIECRLPADQPPRRLSPSKIKFRNALAIASILGVVGLAGISVLLVLAAGIRINSTIADWLFSLIVIAVIPATYFNFILAIARYRWRYLALLFTMACCGVLTLLGFSLFSVEILSAHEPSLRGQMKMSLPWVSAVVGYFCLICLRLGEFIGTFLTRRGELPLLRMPKSRALKNALGLMLGGAITSVFVWSTKPADISEGVNLFVTKLVLPYCCGAFGTGSPLIWILAHASAIVFSMTVLVERFRSRPMAKLALGAFMVLSLLTLWFDGFIVAMFTPIFSSAYWEAFGQTTVTQLINVFVFPLDLCVSIVWLMLWGVVVRALNAEFSDTERRQEAVRPPAHPRRSFSLERIVPVLRTGGASLLINTIVVFVWTGAAMLLVKLFNSGGRDMMLGMNGSMLAATLTLCPLVGLAAVTAFEMRRAPKERLVSWEPWERAAKNWFSHIVVALLAGVLFSFLGCFISLFLAVFHA